MSEHDALDRVRFRTATQLVEIPWEEAQELKHRADVAGRRSLVEAIAAKGISQPVLLSRQTAQDVIDVRGRWDDPPQAIIALVAACKRMLAE